MKNNSKIAKAILVSILVYIALVSLASAIALMFDDGGFLPITFLFVLLVFFVYSFPFYVFLVGFTVFLKELISYKKSNSNRKRFLISLLIFAALIMLVLVSLIFLSGMGEHSGFFYIFLIIYIIICIFVRVTHWLKQIFVIKWYEKIRIICGGLILCTNVFLRELLT